MRRCCGYVVFAAFWWVAGPAWSVELSLPLRTYSWQKEDFCELHAETVPINCVFDHHLTGHYNNRDEYITAFSGERAWSGRGENPLPVCTWSYRQDHPVPFGSFLLNGQYKAAGCEDIWLLADGHPALDFPAPLGTTIYAAASGTISAPTTDLIHRIPQSLFNMLKIDHGDGWSTLYLHCASQRVTSGFVTRGTPIATVGDTGCAGFPHLHFEVRYDDTPVDPYGWEGAGPDPYPNAINHHLWAEAIQASGDNQIYLLRRTYSDARGQWETRKWPVTTPSGGNDSRFLRDIGYSESYIKVLDPATVAAYADGPSVLSPGSLYRRPYFSDAAVYSIGDDRQSHYVSASVFAAWGFDNGDVYVCDSNAAFNTIQADYYPPGAPLNRPGEPTPTATPAKP